MIEQIGKYRVQKELGQGGYGKVYLAFDPDVGQPVAIKMLRAGGDPDLLKRFQMEIRTTASLRHKNIVTIHASGEENGDPYLVMEFLEGSTLKQIIQERRPLSLLEKVSIMTQVAEGLAYAHSKGVVHRDVKPENIMLLADDNVKIMDFGIALGPGRNTGVTQTGGIVGTPPYFAPELLEGHKATEQTDIFSFGDVYYELLAGIHPFEKHKGDWRALQIAIITYEPRPIGELVPGCPERLETLVHRALAKQPEFRYQKIEEVRLDSEAIMVDLKQESAAEILLEIPALKESGHWQSALDRISKARQLDPGNREVRKWHDEINQLIQRERRQKQVGELQANAEKQMTDGRFAEAARNFELASRLDPSNMVIASRMEEAKLRRDNYAKASRLLAEARFQRHKGLLAEAHQLVHQALDSDPENPDGKRLSQQIDEEMRRQWLDEKLQRSLTLAREHSAAKRFAEALAALDEVERDLPGNAVVEELRRDILVEQEEQRSRERAEKFNHAVGVTRSVIETGDFDRARQMLNYLASNFPAHPGADETLPPLWDRFYHQHVHSLVRDNCFREALDLLAEALRKFPGSPSLVRLNDEVAEQERAQKRADAVAAVLKNAAARRDAGDLEGELDVLSKGRQQFADEAAIADRTRVVEKEIAQQRYGAGLDALLKECRSFLGAGNHAATLERLTSAREYAAEPEVRALLESARAAAAIEEERHFVEDLLASTQKLQARELWSKALSEVELGIARYPRNAALQRTADSLREHVERERLRAAIEGHRTAIRREIEASRWNRAQAALSKARGEFPAEARFDDLSDQIEAGLYEQGWRDLEKRIQQHLEHNALSEAEATLEQLPARAAYAQDPRWRNLADLVARRHAYEAALVEADHNRQAGALNSAEDLLTRVIEQSPPDKRAEQMRDAIRTDRAEALRKRQVANLAAAIRSRLEQGELEDAASELTKARGSHPGESVWSAVQAELDARQQALRHQADMVSAEESVRQALSTGDLRQAQALLSAARGTFAGEPVWDDLQHQIEERRAILTRQSEVSAAAAGIRRWLSTDHTADQPKTATVPDLHKLVLDRRNEDVESAVRELASARAKYPDESLWDTLQSEIDGRREFLASELRIRDGVSERLARGEFEQAEAQVAAARAQYPDEHFWNILSGGITRHRRYWQEREEASRFADSIRDGLNRGVLAEARSELTAARAKFPADTRWKELQTDLDSRQAELDRRTAVEELTGRLREQFDQEMHRARSPEPNPTPEAYPIVPVWDALRAAGTRLEQARAKYPNEGAWATLQDQVTGLERRIGREIIEFIKICPDLATLDANARQVGAARSRHPGEAQWLLFEKAIHSRREPLERASIALFDGRIRESLRQDDLPAARSRLEAARAQHPAAAQWNALQNEIDARQEQLRRGQELDTLTRGVREQLDFAALNFADLQHPKPFERIWTAFQSANSAVETGLGKYPGEERLTALRSEIATQRACWENWVVQVIADLLQSQPGRGFSASGVVPQIGVLKAREPGNPLWGRIKTEIDAMEAQLSRQAEVAAMVERIRGALGRDEIRQAVAELGSARAKFPDESAWITLQAEIDVWQARSQVRRQEQRDRARDRLLVIEQEIQNETQTRQRKRLEREAAGMSNGYPEDPEIATIAARIHHVVGAPTAEAPSKPFPWKIAGIGAAVVAALAAALMILPGYLNHPKPPQPHEAVQPTSPSPIAVEIRTDPPGASIRVGDRSCASPNCRLDLLPGSYTVDATLQGYEPKHQSVRIDAGSRLVDLTLNPVAPPEPPPAAGATLVVQAGLSDALVFVDNVPQRNRTGQNGSVSLTLDAKPHEVSVERNGYEKPAAKRVELAAGGIQTVIFHLLPRNAGIELSGAPANVELSVDGSPIGRTDGSSNFHFAPTIPPGDHRVGVNQGQLLTGQGTGSRSITQAFGTGQMVRLIWKADPVVENHPPVNPNNPPPVVPKGPTPEEIEARDWDKVRETPDAGQLRDFIRKYPNGRRRRDAEAALERVVWSTARKDSAQDLQAYLNEFGNGAHGNEARELLAGIEWKAVDTSKRDQIEKFLDKYPASSYAKDARRLLDQIRSTEATQDVFRKQVLDTLSKLNAEFKKKPVKEARIKETWPSIPKSYLESLKLAGQSIELTPVDTPKVQGDSATVTCRLKMALGKTEGQDLVVVLKYGGGAWVISSMAVK